MRLKQLLGLITLLLVLSTVGVAAANSQLTSVNAATQGNATVVTLHASGAFTHTEYRPTDTLLLVDLTGVSAGKLKELTRNVNLPGVNSYHVVEYVGTNGTEVARLELNLEPGSIVTVAQSGEALNINVSTKEAWSKSPAAAPAAEPKPKVEAKAAPAKPVPAKTAPVAAAVKPSVAKTSVPKPEVAEATKSTGLVTVSNVSVVRGEGTLDIEISGSGPMTAKTMKLSQPARVVVDIVNAVPHRNQTVAVNSGDVKDVRVGQFQNSPPVTRIVVDLDSPQDFELVPSGNKLVLKLRDGAATKKPGPRSENQGPALARIKPASLVAAPAPVMQSAAVPRSPVVQKPLPTIAKEAAAPAAVVPSSPKAATTEVTTPATVAALPQSAGKAQEYTVVEPQYHPAQSTAPASDPKATAEAAAQVIESGNKAVDQNLTPPVSATPRPAENLAQEQAQQAAAPAQAARPKYTGEPISVNLKDVDLKDFFRLIHEISGLNIVLDPNVKGTLTLVLDDVPWDQALDLVLANNGLDRKLQGNVLRIATVETMRQEAEAQRAKNEAEALSVPKVTVTHFLSYARATEVVPTVKRFLSQRGDVIADNRTNAVIIQDIPSVIPEVQRLLGQLDRKTQEVEIEARVIAATRNFARDIGTQMGFGWGNRPTAVGGATGVGTSPLQVTTPGTPPYFTVGTNQIPLFSNLPAVGPTSGFSFNNISSTYRLDFVLTAAESRGLVKILSRPRVITQNNVQASVRQGVRIPVVTAAQLGGPPTTTYVEAFLRLTVTPQITVENTIFLNVDLENTTPDFSNEVSGNPTLLTQQATTQVLVTDGGTVVIGGVIQTQNSVNIQQVPLLGSLPYLGNLFKRRAVSTTTQELLFFITPKIIQT
jgi:type IV pilus assembly protein PilQ